MNLIWYVKIERAIIPVSIRGANVLHRWLARTRLPVENLACHPENRIGTLDRAEILSLLEITGSRRARSTGNSRLNQTRWLQLVDYNYTQIAKYRITRASRKANKQRPRLEERRRGISRVALVWRQSSRILAWFFIRFRPGSLSHTEEIYEVDSVETSRMQIRRRRDVPARE